jgi:hypothetical protein
MQRQSNSNRFGSSQAKQIQQQLEHGRQQIQIPTARQCEYKFSVRVQMPTRRECKCEQQRQRKCDERNVNSDGVTNEANFSPANQTRGADPASTNLADVRNHRRGRLFAAYQAFSYFFSAAPDVCASYLIRRFKGRRGSLVD